MSTTTEVKTHEQPATAAAAEYASSYKLPRDANEALRLVSQHNSLVQRQGWLLHPTVAKAMANIENPQIADVACGTGIWAFDLAEKLPDATVTGLDISPAQFPPKFTWPTNSTLDTLNLLEEVPPQYRHKFDVVHCRLLLAAGPNVSWKIFVHTFRQLLKSGGYLQWDEIPYNNMRTVEPILEDGVPTGRYNHTEISFPTMARLSNFDVKNSWFWEFQNHMQQVDGFGEIEQYNTPVCTKTLQLETDVALAVANSMADMLLKVAKIQDEKVITELLRERSQFSDHKEAGTMFGYYWIIGVARAT